MAGQLEALRVAPVVRWAGKDRYETAAVAARTAFAGQADLTAFVASGQGFPDALSGASMNAPLLLTQRSTLPASTSTALRQLRPEVGVVLGGSGVVSTTVVKQVSTLANGGSYRLAGADRYGTSVVVADKFHRTAESRLLLFIASGQTFPDALAAASVAGMTGGALLLTRPDVLPTSIMIEISRLHPSKVIIVGGSAVVSEPVMRTVARLIGSSYGTNM